MGIGDEIMASAQAKALHVRLRAPVLIVDRYGRLRWSEIWDGNPRIAKRYRHGVVRLTNGGGARPYIAAKTTTNWVWKRWDIQPGEIYLNELERRFAAPHSGRILVEPNTKVPDGNKAWPWDRWQRVVDRVGRERFVQVGLEGTRRLDGVEFVPTSFREACAVLAVGRAFVGTEGGLHHAAAALDVPAVVLFSEFISPDITGYAAHRNLRRATLTCGSRLPCAGCRVSMDAISVDEVVENLEAVL